ncbi:hypothetical protein HK096_008460 [Nowakowskiella sp. JEL0078]|nr:hypothetical protein HK096_008460 [Nowakowskiella sp. JEL0078]
MSHGQSRLLERRLVLKNRNNEKIAGILHFSDVLSSQDQNTDQLINNGNGHKNYLFFPLLASKLPMTSFRFDFRGNGESDLGDKPEEDNYERILDEVDDLNLIVNYFISRNWKINTVLGHSRGGSICFLAALQRPFLFRNIVNISGRFFMKKGISYENKDHMHLLDGQDSFFSVIKSQSGREKTLKVTKKTIKYWENLDLKMEKCKCHLRC